MFESKQSSASVKKNIQFETYSKPQYEEVQGSIERSAGEGDSNGGDYYGHEEGRGCSHDGQVMMRDSVKEDNFNNNNNTKSMLSSSQSGRR